MPLLLSAALCLSLRALPFPAPQDPVTPTPQVTVRYADAVRAGAADGRVLLLFAPPDGDGEPRFQVSGTVDSAQVFGLNVLDLEPDEPAVFDADVFGCPHASLAESAPEGADWTSWRY